MHSRIFQFSTEPHERHISCEEIVELMSGSFIGTIADYVDESDREEDIAWLLDYLAASAPDYFEYNPAEGSIIFRAGFKQKYFRQRFEEFKKKVTTMELKDFAEDTYEVYELMQLIDDRHGFYIYMKGYWQTFDSFVRRDMEESRKYFIGATFDYHW